MRMASLIDTKHRCRENDGKISEWAQVLEPVRKLPTIVGTRIRKCVNASGIQHIGVWYEPGSDKCAALVVRIIVIIKVWF
jgi:hypothetical protein